MKLFDALACFGPAPLRPVQEPWKLEQLLADLDHAGINGALVRHAQCFSHDAMAGNYRLVKEIARHRDRLFPCWVVGPHHLGDFPEPAALLREMDKHGVRAVQLRPVAHGYPVHADFLADLAAAFNERRIPILVYNEDLRANYEAWKTLCALFHNCPVLMASVTWGEWRLVDGCMRAAPNLHLIFHRFQAHRAVEEIAARYGAERCIFGSGLPQMSAGAARAFVDWSMLPKSQLTAFAGANLARLLGVKISSLPATPPPADAMIRAARQGKPAPGRVLDAHCHVLEYGSCGVGSGYVMPEGDAPGILRVFDRCGIDGVAMMTWQGPVGLDADAGNELMHRIVKKRGQRILGLTSIDPLHQSANEMVRALRQGLRRGFPGIKPYWPRNCIAYNSPLYNPCWEFANQHGLYALLHTSGDSGGVNSVIDIARRFPDASFLIAHSCGSWDYAELVAKACRAAPNIYAEITLTPVPNGIIEWMCDNAGVNRVLFGTDAPMRDPRPQLGWVVNSRLPLAHKRMVLADNFAAVLARIRWPGGKSLLPPLFRPQRKVK